MGIEQQLPALSARQLQSRCVQHPPVQDRTQGRAQTFRVQINQNDSINSVIFTPEYLNHVLCSS